ncbi:MAG: hypothetical protein DBX55_05775 [Verrucomicrobia bacterium]|nr:MAG: hypothetical protein DBX55_05775 [Verrucomicrobiota bacterium]
MRKNRISAENSKSSAFQGGLIAESRMKASQDETLPKFHFIFPKSNFTIWRAAARAQNTPQLAQKKRPLIWAKPRPKKTSRRPLFLIKLQFHYSPRAKMFRHFAAIFKQNRNRFCLKPQIGIMKNATRLSAIRMRHKVS